MYNNSIRKGGSRMEKLRELRTQYGLTQSQVATQLGISQQAYANYEIGKREPDKHALIKLSELFNVSIDYLFGVADNSQGIYAMNPLQLFDFFSVFPATVRWRLKRWLLDKANKKYNGLSHLAIALSSEDPVYVVTEDGLSHWFQDQDQDDIEYVDLYQYIETHLPLLFKAVGITLFDFVDKILRETTLLMRGAIPSESENDLNSLCNLLDATDKAEIRGEVKHMLKSSKYMGRLDIRGQKIIPFKFYDIPVSAGTGQYLDESQCITISLFADPPAKSEYIVRVNGDSMFPTYKDGDKLFIQPTKTIDIGEIGIFVVNADVYLKELGNGKLISHNPAYEAIPITEFSTVTCLGRVVGKCDEKYLQSN